MPLKTDGNRAWNMWVPRMGLTFRAISTTCRDMEDERERGSEAGDRRTEGGGGGVEREGVCDRQGVG